MSATPYSMMAANSTFSPAYVPDDHEGNEGIEGPAHPVINRRTDTGGAVTGSYRIVAQNLVLVAWALGALLFVVMAGLAAATSYFPADLLARPLGTGLERLRAHRGLCERGGRRCSCSRLRDAGGRWGGCPNRPPVGMPSSSSLRLFPGCCGTSWRTWSPGRVPRRTSCACRTKRRDTASPAVTLSGP